MTAWRVPPGFIHALVTPFAADGALDEEAFQRLIAFHVAHGAAGLAVALHLGESPSLSTGERQQMTDLTLARAGGVPVYVHVADTSVAVQVALARHAAEAGATAIIAPPPYDCMLDDRELLDHYRRLAGACALPIIAYNSPETCATLTPAFLRQLLAECPTVVGLKDSSLDLAYLGEVARDPGNFATLCGVEFLLPMRTFGATSSFAVAAGVAPRLLASLWDAGSRDGADALEAQRRMSGLLTLLAPQYPARFKAAMALLGRGVGAVRDPLPALDETAMTEVADGLDRLGLTASEPRGWS